MKLLRGFFFLPAQIDKQRFGSEQQLKGRKVLNCRLGLMIRGRNVVLKLGSKRPQVSANHYCNAFS